MRILKAQLALVACAWSLVIVAAFSPSAHAQDGPPSLENQLRAVAAARADLLTTNINSTCFEFSQLVLREANDPHWGHVGKTRGEGQFTPANWKTISARGRDGNLYELSGVSHDAIYYCAKLAKDGSCNYSSGDWQVDLLGAGNDSGEPIFDDHGNRIIARPTWNVVEQRWYRVSNPWIPRLGTSAPPLPTPTPAPPVGKPYPGDEFFVKQLGDVLAADYAEAGQTMNAGSSVWFSRTLWRYINEGTPLDKSVIQSRREWRKALGLPE